MEASNQSRLLILVSGLAAGVLAAASPLAPQDPETRLELDRALRDRVVELGRETDADGRSFRRGTFSRNFRAIDENTYQVTFTEDTALGGHMRTERRRLTLRRTPDRRFEATAVETEDLYERLVRDVPGDESYYRFDRFALRREGLVADGGAGTLIVDRVDGRINQLIWTADPLEYRYRPPEEIGFHPWRVQALLDDDRPGDFVFTPEFFTADCDPMTCGQFLDTLFGGLEEVERDDIDGVLEEHYERLLTRQRKRRREDPFADFALPEPPGRRHVTIRIRKKGDDHAVWLAVEPGALDEVRFGATGYDTLWGYPAEMTRRMSPDPRELELRHEADARDYEVRALSGSVEIAVRDPAVLVADLRLTLVARRRVGELHFGFNDLTRFAGRRASDRNPSFTVDAVEDADGNPLTWVRFGTAEGMVVLPAPLEAGQPIDLTMRYQSRGSILKLTPSYSYMDRSGWLPFVRYADKIDAFDLRVTTPARYEVFGVGERREERVEGELRFTHWKASSPIHFPTVIFGKYVHDTPRIRAERSDGSPIQVAIHVDKHGMMDANIRGKQLRPVAEQAVNALNLFREVYATDYPHAKLDVVSQPGFLGGQATASIIYISAAAFRGRAGVARLNRPGSASLVTTLVAHEVAHQWWGASVGNANSNHYWFVESLAEYSAALYAEMIEGADDPAAGRRAYRDKVRLWREWVLASDLLGSVADAPTKWSNDAGLAALYAKGPYVFHMLRTTFGDELFFYFLKMLGQELAGKSAVTRDLQRLAEIGLGGLDDDGEPFKLDLEWFFDQWIRGAGIPALQFDHRVSPTEDGLFLVEGRVRQRVLVGRKKHLLEGVHFRAALDIVAVGRDGTEYPFRLWLDGAETRFRFKVPVKPHAVEFNRDGEILAH